MQKHFKITLAILVLSQISLLPILNLTQIPAYAQTPTKDSKVEADKLLAKGIQLYRKGYNQQALQIYQQVLEIRRRLGDKAGIAAVLNYLGETYNALNKPNQGLEVLQQALKIQQHLGLKAEIGETLHNIGRSYNIKDDYPKALEYYQQALVIRKEVKDRKGEGKTLSSIGFMANFQQQYSKALESLQPALAIHRETGDKYSEGYTLFRIGLVYTNLKDFTRGLEFYQQALSLNREIGNKDAEYPTLLLIGLLYFVDKEDFPRAVEYFEQALVVTRDVKDRETEARVLSLIGSCYASQNNKTDTAIEFYKQALTIQRELKNKSAQLEILGILNLQYKLKALVYDKDDFYPQAKVEYTRLMQSAQETLVLARELKDRKSEAQALIQLADSYQFFQDYKKAEEILLSAKVIGQEIKDTSIESSALTSLNFIYYRQEHYQKRIPILQRLGEIYREKKDILSEISNLVSIGSIYNSLNEYQKAISSFQEALNKAKNINIDQLPLHQQERALQLEPRILQGLSISYRRLKETDKAVDFAQQSLASARKLGKPELEIEALRYLSNTYLSIGNIQKAIEFGKEAVTASQKLQNLGEETLSWLELSDAYAAKGELEQVIEAAQAAQNSARKSKNLIRELKAANQIAATYARLGEFKKQITILQQYEKQIELLDNPSGKAELLITLGNAYSTIGDGTKGKQLVEQGLEIARQIKNRPLESEGLARLGNIYNSLNQYTKAVESLQPSLKIAQEINNPAAQTLPLVLLGGAYSNLGDYHKSNEYYQQALTILRKLQNRRDESLVLLAIAENNIAQGNPQKTIDFAEQALVIIKQLQEPALEVYVSLTLSLGYGELGNDAKAMETAESFLAFAQKTQNTSFEKIAFHLLGYIHRKFGRKEQAISSFQQALAIKADNQILGNDALIYAGLGRTYTDLNQPNIAIGYYKQSINLIEEVRRNIEGLPPELQKSFLNATIDFDKVKTVDIYRQLASLLLSQGREQEAAQVIELLKNQELKDIAAGATTPSKTKIPLTSDENKISAPNQSIIALAKQISECEKTNCKEKSQLNDKLTALVKEFNQELSKIETEIRERIAKDPGAFDPGKLAKAREVVKAQPNTVMIYPLVLEDKLWLLIYSGDAVKKFEVKVSRDELGNTVKQYRSLMEECERKLVCDSADIAKLQPVSQKLYTWLIKPFEAELKQNQVKNLVFALDRVTRYIPMSALHDGQKYLIENYTVHNILSSDLTNTTDKLPVQVQETPVLAMGLSEARANFPALKNVPKELRGILRGSDNTGLYPGQEFLNSAFDFRALRDNLTNNKILHLATHGVFVPDSKNASYLLLGSGDKLAIPEISTLTGLSNIHLVVLSACQTALAGSRQDGVEIASVAYYFLNGGAKAVIASLWQVADESTSLMMQDFYKNMARGEKPTKAEALRLAQLSLLYGKEVSLTDIKRGGLTPEPLPGEQTKKPAARANFAHPYYWAPFILIGNGL